MMFLELLDDEGRGLLRDGADVFQGLMKDFHFSRG